MLAALVAGMLFFWQRQQINYDQPVQQIIAVEDFDLQQVDGKLVYLDFWASWCLPCRRSFPWMQAMVRQYHSRGLRVISVNLDQERSSMEQFIDTYGANFPIVLNPSFSLFRHYGLTGLPSAIVFTRHNNKLVQDKIHRGFEDSQAEALEAEIAQLLQT